MLEIHFGRQWEYCIQELTGLSTIKLTGFKDYYTENQLNVDNMTTRKMIPFDLSKIDENGKGKDGYEVVYRDGRKPVRLIYVPENHQGLNILTIRNHDSAWWHFSDGEIRNDGTNTDFDLMLLCPEPKKLSGFVNVYPTLVSKVFETNQEANQNRLRGCIACIDLSQFEEGHGL